jgi:hypothetical protein
MFPNSFRIGSTAWIGLWFTLGEPLDACGYTPRLGRGFAMEFVVVLFWVIPIALAWLLVYSAVLAALRRHDRESV